MLTSAGSTASSFPLITFEAQSLQLSLTAYCLDLPVLSLWSYPRRPRVLYPAAGLPYWSGTSTRWNTRPCLAALTPIPTRYAEVFDPDAALVFVPTLDRTARTRNRRDAALVAELCAVAIDGGLTPQQIGIVAPYRAQGQAIRLALKARLGYDGARHIVADTVERMQDQERELIVVSLATGEPTFLAAVAEFFFQPERLNVSITRAMTKLILIGPEAPDPAGFQPETLRLWLMQYRDLLAACRRVAF